MFPALKAIWTMASLNWRLSLSVIALLASFYAGYHLKSLIVEREKAKSFQEMVNRYVDETKTSYSIGLDLTNQLNAYRTAVADSHGPSNGSLTPDQLRSLNQRIVRSNATILKHD